MLIENFRLISVSPHLEPFEQSPMNALCLSFGDPEASFIKLIYGSLEGFIDLSRIMQEQACDAKNSSQGPVLKKDGCTANWSWQSATLSEIST